MPGLDTGVVLEYQLNRRTNACTGHEPEIRLRLSGNGRLEIHRTRSFAESDRSGPGAFQGGAGKAEWDSLFKFASRMEWEYPPMGMPMPGMSESNHVIILTHAGKSARFDFSGSVPPGQQSVSQCLDFPLPKPKNVARVSREGNLMHLGFSVALQEAAQPSSAEVSAKESADTSAVVTLFSDYFEF